MVERETFTSFYVIGYEFDKDVWNLCFMKLLYEQVYVDCVECLAKV